MPTFASLPQEIVDRIIGSFNILCKEDKLALRACALVAQSFRYRAQQKLFRTLYLDCDLRPDGISRVIKNLYDVLHDQPQLASHTRCLSVDIGFNYSYLYENANLLAIVGWLVNMEEVVLAYCGPEPLNSSLLEKFWIPHIRPRLRKLTFTTCIDLPFALCRQCPKLETLILRASSAKGFTDQPDHRLDSAPMRPLHLVCSGARLSTSVFRVGGTEAELALMPIHFYHLQSLDWTIRPREWLGERQSFNIILRDASRSLKKLIIRDYLSGIGDELELGQLAVLEEASFHSKFSKREEVADYLSSVLDALAPTTSSLRHIDMQLAFDGDFKYYNPTGNEWLHMGCWSSLDEAAARWQTDVGMPVTISLHFDVKALQAVPEKWATYSESLKGFPARMPLTDSLTDGLTNRSMDV